MKNNRYSLHLLGFAFVLFFGMATTLKTDHGKFFEISKNIEIFTNLYKEINTSYVDDLDPGQLMRKGIDAMLESLDPYTNYISESEIEGYRYITEGKYNGIGAIFNMIDGYVTVTQLYADSPAAKADLKPGDRILSVDGKSAEGKKEEEVRAILKGYPGTEVLLTVERPGVSNSMKINLMREQVSVSNVPYSGMVNDDIGYAALTTFTREAGKNVADALKDLKAENPNLKGFIFDLRGNGGGLLTEAVNVSNVFIPKGELVVTTKGKVKDWDRSFKTLNKPVDQEIPVVVLINKNSASASEIVSGVLQDYDRAILMGQRSYGKGLVQNTRDIGYNSKVKMTTAKYYIPSGRCIQSVEYENGEPVDIADTKRAKFETRGGRTVLDGGGVHPDILIDEDGDSEILTTLRDKYIIFKYVTEFVAGKDTTQISEDFTFSEWSNFVAYLEKTKFDYDTKSEKLLKELKVRAEEDGYLSSPDITALEQKIIQAKKSDLEKHKPAIIDMIEKEAVGRYYFKRGQIKISLRNDEEIDQAVKVIGDSARFKKTLSEGK